MKQEYSSANTSVNSSCLPAIYNIINWNTAYNEIKNKVVLDIGAGKYIQHIKDFVNWKGFDYYPYDPYNLPECINNISKSCNPGLVICSNVLNVIKEDEIIKDIHRNIIEYNVPYFITVYSRDRDNIGKVTQGGQSYQRNADIDSYLLAHREIIYRKVITMDKYKKYLERRCKNERA